MMMSYDHRNHDAYCDIRHSAPVNYVLEKIDFKDAAKGGTRLGQMRAALRRAGVRWVEYEGYKRAFVNIQVHERHVDAAKKACNIPAKTILDAA